MEKAIQYDTNWRMGNWFLNQGNPSKQKADTNKSNGNTCWWRTNEKRDPNAMDVDALTMEERGMLLRQGKCFCCKKTGHMQQIVTTLNNVSELSLYSRLVLSETLLSTVVV
jgi:hypothetical protein